MQMIKSHIFSAILLRAILYYLENYTVSIFFVFFLMKSKKEIINDKPQGHSFGRHVFMSSPNPNPNPTMCISISACSDLIN